MTENGDEELYDRANDPNEFNNIAGDPKYLSVKQNLAANIPAATQPAVAVTQGARPAPKSDL